MRSPLKWWLFDIIHDMSVFDISLMMVFMGLSGNVSIELPSALSRTLKTLYGAFSAELYKVFLPLVALCDK